MPWRFVMEQRWQQEILRIFDMPRHSTLGFISLIAGEGSGVSVKGPHTFTYFQSKKSFGFIYLLSATTSNDCGGGPDF